MLNWPGPNENAPPLGGSSSSVTTSRVSRCDAATRHRAGALHPPYRAGSASGRIPVHIQQLQAGRLQPLRGDTREALHEVEAQAGVRLAFTPQAYAVQGDRPYRPDRPCVKLPGVWLEQP